MSYLDDIVEKHAPKAWDGHINASGLAIIKRYEGWRSSPYLCAANRATIGWGSTWDINGNPVTLDHPDIDEEQGTALLKKEITHVEKGIRRLIKAELTENMFSALCSFAFNVGTGNLQRSTLRMKLNRGQYEDAADEFKKWKKAGGRTLKGLVRRRASERQLFLRE